VGQSLLKIFFYNLLNPLENNKYCLLDKFKASNMVVNDSWDDVAFESLKIKKAQTKDGVQGETEHAATTESTEM